MFAESYLEYIKLVKKIKDTAPLIEAVFLECARYLNSLSLLRGMRYYYEKVGEKAFSRIVRKQSYRFYSIVVIVHTSAFYSFNSGC